MTRGANLGCMTEMAPAPQVWPTLRAGDAHGLIRFLVDVVGFQETVVYSDGEIVHHAELAWPPGGGVMLGSAAPEGTADSWPVQPGSFGAYLVTDTPDELYEKVRSAGAEIIAGLHETDYGSRDFSLRDPEGNRWSFGTYRGAPRKMTGGSAIDRFRTAAAERDVARAAAEMAPDIRMFNPMSDQPLVGRQAVTEALIALDTVFDQFRHVDVLTNENGTASGLRFQANVGEHVVHGIDLLEVDDEGRISSITVMARPLSALKALMAALAARRGQS